ncbi:MULTISPECIES: FadR/GntR family transcriptional regulator [unclassified Rhizobium]|jgi:DNA-binding FadR family transcriptional regulator|uniref:FadR/GntR family transcriptional regulator n=1 Tax=unclassified Rhizobium TaxID=2613769 RepID=UPI00146DF83E|nr:MULTISPECIES: FadR/GntR family transcriptional regulator [unclassified Rhizobium]MBD9445114.1 FadR family transcriptional regulator [Rhizobium sp. RHZ01]MBD9454428.1 FadR family transcriptional regulator [Rhizobium sp. RHZ02]NMN71403.1 DNA-binding FadR family transcriptional regulator [Rhizobium sp. 57MFTsu3.2]
MATVSEVVGNAGLVSNAIGAITAHIRMNELGPGDRLPSEGALSKELSVSRTVVREAFRSLAAMRLIDLRVGKRAMVAQLDHGAMSLMIEHGIDTAQINVQQIYDVRRTIEVRTATLAALRRSNDEARAILEHAEAMRTNFDAAERVMESDLAFHLEIARASKNPIFAMIVGAFQGVSRQTWPIGWRSRSSDNERHAMNDLHVAIAEAIVAGDPQAASQLMAQHFEESVKALLAAGVA